MSNLPDVLIVGSADAGEQNRMHWQAAALAYRGHATIHHYIVHPGIPPDVPWNTLIFFLAKDAMPDSHWLEAVAEWISQRSNVGIVGTSIVRPDEVYERPGWELLYPHLLNIRRDSSAPPTIVDAHKALHVIRGTITVRAETYHRLGAFTPELGDSFFADLDLCRRASAAGLEIWLLPQFALICQRDEQRPYELADEQLYKDQQLAFTLHYSKPTTDNPRSVTFEPDSIHAIREALTVASVTLTQSRAYASPKEFEFMSQSQVAGRLIATIRRMWFGIAAKWAIRSLIQQQSQFNQNILSAIEQLANALTLVEEQLEKQLSVVPGKQVPHLSPSQVHESTERVIQALLNGDTQ